MAMNDRDSIDSLRAELAELRGQYAELKHKYEEITHQPEQRERLDVHSSVTDGQSVHVSSDNRTNYVLVSENGQQPITQAEAIRLQALGVEYRADSEWISVTASKPHEGAETRTGTEQTMDRPEFKRWVEEKIANGWTVSEREASAPYREMPIQQAPEYDRGMERGR